MAIDCHHCGETLRTAKGMFWHMRREHGFKDDARESARRLRDALAVDFGPQRAAPASVAQINAQVAQAAEVING